MAMRKSNRSSQGRQKIPIAKIAKRTNLQVTFSKRRSGLFKKASELCTLCGVEIAIVVFSPANKPYSFGHPDVDSLIDRLLTRNPNFNTSLAGCCQQLDEAHKNASAHELNMQLTRISNQVEAERKRGESLDKMSKASECWWEKPVDELGLDELQIIQAALEELKKNVNEQTNRIWMESSNTTGIANNSSSFFITNNDHHLSRNSGPSTNHQVGSDYIDIPRAYDFGMAGNIGLF